MRLILLLAAGVAVASGQTTDPPAAPKLPVFQGVPKQWTQPLRPQAPFSVTLPSGISLATRECVIPIPNAYRSTSTKFPMPVVKPNQFAAMNGEVAQGMRTCGEAPIAQGSANVPAAPDDNKDKNDKDNGKGK